MFNSVSPSNAYTHAFFNGKIQNNNLDIKFKFKNIPIDRKKNPQLDNLSDGTYTWILTEEVVSPVSSPPAEKKKIKNNMYISHVGIFELGTKHLHLIKNLNENIIAAGEFLKDGNKIEYNMQSGTFQSLNKKISNFSSNPQKQVKFDGKVQPRYRSRIPPNLYSYDKRKAVIGRIPKNERASGEEHTSKSHGAFKKVVLKGSLHGKIKQKFKQLGAHTVEFTTQTFIRPEIFMNKGVWTVNKFLNSIRNINNLINKNTLEMIYKNKKLNKNQINYLVKASSADRKKFLNSL